MNFSKIASVAGALAISAVLTAGAWAQAAIPMTRGEVKKLDPKAQTVTIAHGPIKNLDMPAMTMVFKVKTPALLEKVKAGDQVKFIAEMPGGTLTISAMETLR